MGNTINKISSKIHSSDSIVDPSDTEPYEPNTSPHSIETTIFKVHEYNEKTIRIECNPRPFVDREAYYDNCLYLKKNHPNYINLYNKLIMGASYNFIFKKNDGIIFVGKPMIVDIIELQKYNICGIVRGFINIANEHKNIENHHEIIMDNKDNKKRLLICNKIMEHMIINKKYVIYYEKRFGGRFYHVTEVELCDNYN